MDDDELYWYARESDRAFQDSVAVLVFRSNGDNREPLRLETTNSASTETAIGPPNMLDEASRRHSCVS